MERTLAGTDLPPSAVHAIIEIGMAAKVSAKELSDKLLLEKSTISRLIKSLEQGGEVRVLRSELDARIKYIHLTPLGKRTLAAITDYAESQVAGALSLLDQTSRRNVVSGLETYSAALRANRMSDPVAKVRNPPIIGKGYLPGMVGRIVEMHASYYSNLVGFGAAFETKVAGDLAEFVARLGKPRNAIWYALHTGTIIGSIAIDGEDLGAGKAHLRWFIVDERMQGSGLGQALLRRAINHCKEQEVQEIHLWTFKGLDAARSLYEKYGFVLNKECTGDQWGTEVLEQKFVWLRQS